MRRLFNVVVSLVILFGLVFGTVELVRLANGDFAGDYKLNGTFPRAGEGLVQLRAREGDIPRGRPRALIAGIPPALPRQLRP